MFCDRQEAGVLLARRLHEELNIFCQEEVIVLSIPRGGVVVGISVATELHAGHDIIVARKLQSPHEEELAVGAVTKTHAGLYFNHALIESVGLEHTLLERVVRDKQQEVERRELLYRGKNEMASLHQKIVVIVDDGAATGATAIVAVRSVWEATPKRVIVALPVCPLDTVKTLEREADAVITLTVPEDFFAVSQFYQDFPQVSDSEVIALLSRTS